MRTIDPLLRKAGLNGRPFSKTILALLLKIVPDSAKDQCEIAGMSVRERQARQRAVKTHYLVVRIGDWVFRGEFPSFAALLKGMYLVMLCHVVNPEYDEGGGREPCRASGDAGET